MPDPETKVSAPAEDISAIFSNLIPPSTSSLIFRFFLSKISLNFSKQKGNDLSTPRPEFSFPGLKEGDSWCLCAERWKEAFESGKAPKVYLRKTHKKTLEIVDINILKQFALDLD